MINFGKGRGRLAVATRKWADSLGEVPESVAMDVEAAVDAANAADGARTDGAFREWRDAVQLWRELRGEVDRVVSGDGGGGRSAVVAVPDAWERLVGADPDPVVDAEDSGSSDVRAGDFADRGRAG